MLFSELIELAEQSDLKFCYSLPHNNNVHNDNTHIIKKFCFDSREIEKNSLFLCIKGEKTNGHDYISQAIKAGASALIAEKDFLEIELATEKTISIPILYVENTLFAVQKLAQAKRKKYKGKVIAITGSSGKTSVKEMLSQLLSYKGSVTKNLLNYNTQLGVSISILNAQGNEDFWILEAGISQEHDMQEIAQILMPDIALILNVGLAHAQGLPKGAAFYKTQLLKYMNFSSKNAVVFVSEDYAELVLESKKRQKEWKKENLSCELFFFSIENKNALYYGEYLDLEQCLEQEEVKSNSIKEKYTQKGLFLLKLKENTFKVSAPLRSSYNAENCIALASIASLSGMREEEIKKAFSTLSSPKQRFELFSYKKGNIILLDDSYNANPLSFQRMLLAASEYTLNERKEKKYPLICIVGAMYELGKHAEQEHMLLGEQMAKQKVDFIFYKGDYQKFFEEGLARQKYKEKDGGKFFSLNEKENFEDYLKDLNFKQGVFFVKGSRSNRLEQYVKVLKNFYTACS